LDEEVVEEIEDGEDEEGARSAVAVYGGVYLCIDVGWYVVPERSA
jgi:drug/metabolite transporter superfamily protein YnfA